MDLHGIFRRQEDDFSAPKKYMQYVEITEYITKSYFPSG